ncbi:MAG TPA: LytS/YhcK type 5TM receptor domain-containing protein [Methylomirabilota bacterium]|nr:LytS/YhcK type 5TM receptor domain-containing protein [Methylomirabilota bacterium]
MVLGVVFYSYTYQWFQPGHRGSRPLRMAVNGVLFGLLALALMTWRIELASGDYIDARVVPIALVGLLEGWPAALLAAVLPVLYRVWLGGSGAPAGVTAILASAALGALAHLWARRDGRLTLRHTLALTAAVYLVTWVSFVLAGAYAVSLFARSWFWLLVTYVVGIVFTGRLMGDVVEQARLMAERGRFRAILDEASEAIRIVDPDTHRIIDVNRRDCELSGYARAELVGRDDRDRWPAEPELRALHEAAEAEVRQAGACRTFGLPCRRGDGTLVTIDSSRRVVTHGGRRYEIVVGRDAAEREATEAARREAAELRAVTMLAGAAAHEINNPLAVVMGALDLLARDLPGDGRPRRLIDQGLAGVRRVSDIVLRMRTITRVQAQEVAPNLPPILDIEKSSREEPWTSSST